MIAVDPPVKLLMFSLASEGPSTHDLRAGRRAVGRYGVRRLFPGISDNTKAQECARTIAGWQPLPATPAKKRSVSRPQPVEPGQGENGYFRAAQIHDEPDRRDK